MIELRCLKLLKFRNNYLENLNYIAIKNMTYYFPMVNIKELLLFISYTY